MLEPRVAFAATLCLAGAASAAPRPVVPGRTARCERVDLEAETGICDGALCRLEDSVVLRCEGLAVWADLVEIDLGPEQTFAGARASGNVLIVEGDSVITCSKVTVGPDQIQGRIDAATVRLKRDPTERSEQGVPIGRDRAVFHGEIERPDAGRLLIEGADFTLCDCGDKPPSWRLDAARIEAEIDDRALLWWPQLKINPFGLGLIPVTPPLLPLSVPLERRAAGFLAPRILFLRPPWPIVDLPFFVPVGASWDLTIEPGIRTDWGRHQVTPPSTWGAPRFGARLRYAPAQGTSGVIHLQWTWDRKHQAARLYRVETLGLDRQELEALDETDSRWRRWKARDRLEHRVAVDITHRSDLSERLSWLTDVHWVSDDLYPRDFRLTLDERVPGYMPSRTLLLWRRAGAAASLDADYLLAVPTGEADDFSNLHGAEQATAHRGPAVRLRLLPTAVGDGVYLDADVAAVRYGPWTRGLPVTRSLVGGAVGAAVRDAVGPVALGARAGLDALWVDPLEEHAVASATGTLDANASVRLAARLGDVAHVVEPRLAYRGLTWQRDAPPSEPAVDERLDRSRMHQAVAVLDQSLVRKADQQQMARLLVEQPVDLASGKLLQTRAHLSGSLPGIASGAVWAGVDPHQPRAVQELGAHLRLTAGPLSAWGQYARWLPYADRFRRTFYELGATRDPVYPDALVHVLRAGAGLRLGSWARLSYTTDVVLPDPDADERRETGFVQHVAGASYASPCDCWQIDARVVMPRKDPLANFGFSIALTVAGYSVGN